MPRTKSAPKPLALDRVKVVLPKRIHVSDDELAVVTRLIRVMRQQDPRGSYWLGPFIEWLLYLDADNPDLAYILPDVALKALPGMEEILQGDCKFIKMVRKECPGLKFVSTPKDHPGTLMTVPQDEEEQFFQLIRLWRIEHPEPPKRREIPAAGKTQHEMDPDTD